MKTPLTGGFGITLGRIAVIFLGTVGLSFGADWIDSTNQPRVIRLVIENDWQHWVMSMNGTNESPILSKAGLTNQLTKLGLHHGDVLLQEFPSRRPNRPLDSNEWLRRYCSTNMVPYYVIPRSKLTPISSTPIFHWSAPFSDPLTITNATFFLEGKVLGTGVNGFQQLLKHVEQMRARNIFILGCLLEQSQGFEMHTGPFEEHGKILEETLERSGTKRIMPSIVRLD